MPDSRIYLGTSAWSYPLWRGKFYPSRLKASDYLPYYAQYFHSVEVDSTFYQIPSLQLTRGWHEKTPPEFRFCIKVPRQISHESHLKDCQSEVTLFLQALNPIHEKTTRIFLQLPPSFTPRDEYTLKRFLLSWPRSFPLAIDFRNPDWHQTRIDHFLKTRDIAWTWSDMTSPEDKSFAALDLHPRCSSDLYIRLLGNLQEKYAHKQDYEKLYGTILWDRSRILEEWSLTIKNHLTRPGTRVFCFVNNHFEGFAPLSAQRLGKLLGIKPRQIEQDKDYREQQELPGT